jgi:putative transposase
MPSRFVVRNLQGNSYYHVYNSGSAKDNIFVDEADYKTFLYYLFIYSAPREAVIKKYPRLPTRLKAKNMSNDIFLISYCLLPNHFHLLLKQKPEDAMPKFMKQVINGYLTYFNKKYKKSGTIFRGRYKSVRIESEYLLVQMIRFVHLNPSIHSLCQDIKDYSWSSFTNPLWGSGIINRFKSVEEWENFHDDKKSYELNFNKIKDLTID